MKVNTLAAALLAATLPLCAQVAIFPLSAVKAGQRGTGKTVFSGTTISEFDVEILGVLENAGPKQSIILGRLSGGPLAQSGVLQGMSGSPVYIDNKLVGAVAMAFAFAKEPIAGIRPIEEMLAVKLPPVRAQLDTAPAQIAAGAAKLVDIATPLSLGGFTPRTVDQFAPQLRALGLEPMQGSLSGRSSGPASQLPPKPGSMISVHLITGDFNVGADGTVTHVDGNKVYAFGHRFLSIGATDLPFSRSEVLTLLPNLNTSFKISASREPLGVITSDYTSAIAGELNRRANMVPATIHVTGRDKSSYRLNIARDRLLSPFLLQMALFSAIDATERTAGAATVRVRGKMDFIGAPPILIDNTYASDNGAFLPASLAASIPLSYAMQSGFPELTPRAVDLDVDVANESKLYRLDGFWASPTTVHPGGTVSFHALLAGPGGREVRKTAQWKVPIGQALGNLVVTAADAFTVNVQDYGFIINQPPTTLAQVLKVLNGLRPNSNLNVRIARQTPGYTVRGYQLPDPPPSVAQLLRRHPGEALPAAQSRIAEFDFAVPDTAVSGAKTIQIEIKE